MSELVPSRQPQETSRRGFLQQSATLTGAALTAGLPLARNVHAAGSDVIRIGLIGCGGRGCGAAMNALNAGEDVRLVAMTDLFAAKAEAGRKRLKGSNRGQQVVVDDDHLFSGFDGCQQVIESDVDVVLIAAASHFHPRMLEAAVQAGKHVFCEKPHSLDSPGVKRVVAACDLAREKKRCVVSGLMNRYNPCVRETVQRIHDGAIGRVSTIQETYCVGPYHVRRRNPEWTELEFQFQNWYHFNWLAGDQCMQQLIHSIDKGAWVMRDEPPVKAWGMGGRSACFGEEYGDLFDHQTVVYEYADGVRMYGLCRNQSGVRNELSDMVFGTKGAADLLRGRIEGENNWRYEGPTTSPYELEHQELFAAIRAGELLNDGRNMAGSTLLALLAQFVCHTGQELTWELAVESKLSFELPRYAWDVDPPLKPNDRGEYDIAIPGITKFV